MQNARCRFANAVYQSGLPNVGLSLEDDDGRDIPKGTCSLLKLLGVDGIAGVRGLLRVYVGGVPRPRSRSSWRGR